MPLPFDATLKQLVQAHPRDWLEALHVPAGDPVEVLTPDLSTVTRFADTVLRVGDRGILHLDFQSGPDPALPRWIRHPPSGLARVVERITRGAGAAHGGIRPERAAHPATARVTVVPEGPSHARVVHVSSHPRRGPGGGTGPGRAAPVAEAAAAAGRAEVRRARPRGGGGRAGDRRPRPAGAHERPAA